MSLPVLGWVPPVAECGWWQASTPGGAEGRPVGELLSSPVGQRSWLVPLVLLLPQLCVQLLVAVAVLHFVGLPLGCVRARAGPRSFKVPQFAVAAIEPFAVLA